MRRSVKALRIRAGGIFLPVVVETKRYGYGKVRLERNGAQCFLLLLEIFLTVFTVHPDSDFECMGVLMEHSQDVKCVAWHPSEEVGQTISYFQSVRAD